MTFNVRNLVFGLLVISISAAQARAVEDRIDVTIIGKLRTGIFAIGGETTGTTITSGNITWELDLSQTPTLKKAAEQWNKKQVQVQGVLTLKQGVETGPRYIVKVTKLSPPKKKPARVETKTSKRADNLNRTAVNALTIEPQQPGCTLICAAQKTILEVHSEKGIGTANVLRLGDSWPPKFTIKLHLKGLELLSADNGRKSLEWSVSSHAKETTIVSLRQGRQETTLKQTDALHAPVRIVGTDKTIPLTSGCFEVTIPAMFLKENPQSLKIRWIDFYR